MKPSRLRGYSFSYIILILLLSLALFFESVILGEQTSNCCIPNSSRGGCDNSTIQSYVINSPDMESCASSWSAYCAEFVYRNLDFCVVECGDQICAVKSGENCESCPEDCGQCTASKSCSSIYPELFKTWTSLNDTYNIFQDPLLNQQWYIRNTGQQQYSFKATPGIDVNVLPVYQQYQIFGDGVIVSIVDDGVEWRHPDLQCGYQPELSADIDNGIKFQQPSIFDGHGTCCAGLCCGQGNNSVCGMGIAFKSKISGIRVLGNNYADSKCAEALVYGLNEVDIYSNSWGPTDDGMTIDRYPLSLKAIEKGIREGRGGRGAIYLWAGGNGYQRGDGSNYDELANSPYTISIAASNWNGFYSIYSEPGTNILVNAPSSTYGRDPASGQFKYYSTIVTTDRMGFTGYNNTQGRNGNCVNNFGGTSASCPLVAGILALVLEANPKLTWRDMQWLIIKSSYRNDPTHPSWHRNGAGYYFSKHYGFGLIDAYSAVTMALNWTLVCSNYTFLRKQFTVTANGTVIPSSGISIPKNSSDPLILKLSFDDLPNMFIEHVSISITASIRRRGQLVFAIASPNHTVSVISEGRYNDYGSNYEQQIFTTVELWGESSKGQWLFSIYDNNRDKTIPASTMGKLLSVEMTIMGTYPNCDAPDHIIDIPSPSPSPEVIKPKAQWLPLQIRNIITISLISSASLVVIVVILVLVFKMQGSAETELNSEIWNEMIEDDPARNEEKIEEGRAGEEEE